MQASSGHVKQRRPESVVKRDGFSLPALSLRPLLLLVSLLFVQGSASAQQHHPRQHDALQSHVTSAPVGEITRSEGDVWLRRGAGGRQQLRAGDGLDVGDVVVTGADGLVEWTLGPGSSLRVGVRSRVRVYSADADRMHFGVERGEVIAYVRALVVQELQLDTPPAVLNVVRGGSYRVRVAPDDATEVSVLEGELQYVNVRKRTVSVTTGGRARFPAAARRKSWDTAPQLPGRPGNEKQ